MIRGTATAPGGPRRLPAGRPSPLALALGPAPGVRPPGSMVGVEHEYSLSVDGERLDFRQLIHELPVPGRRLDPGDLNAYRCPSGLAITCDAEDAEVVSPPLAVHPGFAADVEAWAEHGRSELVRLIPTGITVTPFSTHVSASMPDAMVDAACDLFARTFAPALTLILGGADSHGVFIRPRPGRLEVCGEHVVGARLGAAATLVAGGARACAAFLAPGGPDGGRLPPLLAVDVRPARGRRGLFVGRHVAFGQDLLDAGRGGGLPLLGGGTVPAAEHLVAVWDSVRIALGDDAGTADFRAGDAIVAGTTPLEGHGVDEIGPSSFGDLLETRRRPGFEAAAAAATWDFTVFRLTGAARHAYACVPGVQLGRFLDRLDAGSLDGLVGGFLDAAPTGQVLTAHDETVAPGLWDDAVIGPELLPYEQSAAEAALEPSGSVTYVRRGKGVVVITAPAPLTSSPISAGGSPVAAVSTVPPGVAVVLTGPATPPSPATVRPPVPTAVAAVRPAGVQSATPIAPAPAEPPLPPTNPPVVERRRRRRLVLACALLVLLLAAGAAAMAGVFTGGKQGTVEIVTGPASPSTSPDVTVALSTSSTAEPPTTTGPATTTIPPPTVTTATPPPSTATTAAPTAVPVQTTLRTTPTVATTTTVDTTTTVSLAPTQLVVGVASGALGCVFQPPAATVRQGSTVRFRNDTPGGITITFPTPGAATTISLDAGGTSGPLPLGTAGSFTITCTPGGDAIVGRMALTVTAA